MNLNNEETKCERLWKGNERIVFFIRNNPKGSFFRFSLEIHVWFKRGKFYKVGGSLNRAVECMLNFILFYSLLHDSFI